MGDSIFTLLMETDYRLEIFDLYMSGHFWEVTDVTEEGEILFIKTLDRPEGFYLPRVFVAYYGSQVPQSGRRYYTPRVYAQDGKKAKLTMDFHRSQYMKKEITESSVVLDLSTGALLERTGIPYDNTWYSGCGNYMQSFTSVMATRTIPRFIPFDADLVDVLYGKYNPLRGCTVKETI